MATILSNIAIVLYVVAGVCLVLAVVLWFVFDIPTVFGDLSGRTARKSIAKMRENNEKSGKKAYKPSKVNEARGTVTSTASPLKHTKEQAKTVVDKDETGLLAENRVDTYDSQQTALLDESEETALLNETEETALLNEEQETALLVEDNETALLVEEADIDATPLGGKHLVIMESVMMIHTNEVI